VCRRLLDEGSREWGGPCASLGGPAEDPGRAVVLGDNRPSGPTASHLTGVCLEEEGREIAWIAFPAERRGAVRWVRWWTGPESRTSPEGTFAVAT
jgi:hypothetical protein